MSAKYAFFYLLTSVFFSNSCDVESALPLKKISIDKGKTSEVALVSKNDYVKVLSYNYNDYVKALSYDQMGTCIVYNHIDKSLIDETVSWIISPFTDVKQTSEFNNATNCLAGLDFSKFLDLLDVFIIHSQKEGEKLPLNRPGFAGGS